MRHRTGLEWLTGLTLYVVGHARGMYALRDCGAAVKRPRNVSASELTVHA
jgi:hypothetical protein